jgi:hypothetical protein
MRRIRRFSPAGTLVLELDYRVCASVRDPRKVTLRSPMPLEMTRPGVVTRIDRRRFRLEGLLADVVGP